MPIIPIRDLVGGGGVNLDVSPNDLPPNAFSNVINGRFSRKRIERYGGDELYQDSNSDPELTNARAIFEIIRQGNEGFCLISGANVYIDIGVGWVDVSPAINIVDSDEWNLSQYGDWLILSVLAGTQEPIVLAPTGSQFIPFAEWPSGYQAIKIFPYKNFLIAVGIEISNNPQNGFVKWSDTVDESNLSAVDWDTLNPASLAGENTLPSADGLIQDGGVLRDSGILYTDTSVWRMDISNAQAGITPLVFNFRKIFDDEGILRNRCFVEVNGKHYVVGIYDIYLHDGFNKISISDNKITEFFYSRLGTGNFSFMTHYNRPQEIVISYSAQQNNKASEAIVYNYFYNTWTRMIVNSALVNYTHLILAPEFLLASKSWADLQAEGTLWSDLNTTSWNALFPQNKNRVPYLLVPGTETIYFIDRNSTTSNSVDFLLERLDLDLDEFFEGVRNIKHLKNFIPQVTGDGIMILQFGGRNALGEEISWQPEGDYDLLTDYQFPLRISWRYLSMRIIQRASGNALQLTGFDLNVHQVSRR